MPPINAHEWRHVPPNDDNSRRDPWPRLLVDLTAIPLCFALLIAVWGLAGGEAPWWGWAGLAWYGVLGAWAVWRALRSRFQQEARLV